MKALLAAAILSLALVNPASATKPPWAGPHPKPSPTPAPTVSPVKPWSIVFITYRSIDATCNGLAVKTTLSDAEYAEALQLEHDAVANINAWNPGIGLTPTYVTRSVLTTLTPLGSGCWIGPEAVSSPGAFDSAYIIFDPRNAGDYWFGWGGLSKTSTHHDYLRALISGTLPDLNGDGHSDGITSWQQQMAGTPTT